MPIVIAHRGSSGKLPENTLEAFQLAIEQNSDVIELDIVSTKDGVLIVRHEVYLSRSTNVASTKKFTQKKTTKMVDGILVEDWFAIDFTLAEIKELKSTQPFLKRPREHNNKYNIPTLAEAIALVKKASRERKNQVGLCIEIKNSIFHEINNKSIEDLLIELLKNEQWHEKNSPAIVMSFELKCLKYIKKNIAVKVYQLFDEYNIEANNYLQPYDFVVNKDKRTYMDLLSKEGLVELKKYAEGLCLWKGYLVNKQYEVVNEKPNLVDFAHEIGLGVFLWTFNENRLLKNCSSIEQEYKPFYELGVDGIITDYPKFAQK